MCVCIVDATCTLIDGLSWRGLGCSQENDKIRKVNRKEHYLIEAK